MIDHIKLLSVLIILFSGSWLIIYLRQINRLYPYTFIKAITNYVLTVIVTICLQFLSMYIRKNINSEEFLLWSNCLRFAAYIGIFLTFYQMVNVLVSFRDKPFSKSINKRILLLVSLLIIGCICNTFIPELQNLLNWVDQICSNALLLADWLIYLELLILIGFYFIWINPQVNCDRKRISRSFTILYILVDCLTIIALGLIDHFQIQGNYIWLIVVMNNLVIIFIPFLWIKNVFLDYAQRMLNLINDDDKFKTLYDKYKISKREKEIIELLIDGKCTNEIKEILFLSYHTVKNHISHIYGKLNVKTRHELILFFIKEK